MLGSLARRPAVAAASAAATAKRHRLIAAVSQASAAHQRWSRRLHSSYSGLANDVLLQQLGGQQQQPLRPLQRHQASSALVLCQSSARSGSPASPPSSSKGRSAKANLKKTFKAVRRSIARLRSWLDSPEVRVAGQLLQFVLAIVFVALYVWGTYSPPAPDSFRSSLDLWLCAVFALEYLHRMLNADSKLRMLRSVWNVCDLLSFVPPLLDVALRATGTPFGLLAGVDLRWTKILRSMRVLRVGLLSSELRSLHLSTRKGGFLSAGTNFRLLQLLSSVLILLFTTSSVIQIVEKMTFHQALYMVVTTLTTVGFGDVVPRTFLGKSVIIATISIGVVMIPVQAAQLYAEFTARRVVRGSMPNGGRRAPMVLLSTRLTEVRAFSDFYSEFQQALSQSPLFPPNTKMLVLCNRPSYEFGAFQELHDRRVTFMEGSAVSGQDLVSARAERARACLLLADRFTTDPEQEDLSILFQVWAMKSYTKTVPLYVQTVRQSMVEQIAPFLDPGQDVVVSMEQTRLRLLALSAVCPGASTLVGNLLKSSAVRSLEGQQRTLAGREWLRRYVNGCAYQILHAPVPPALAGRSFSDVAQWLYWTAGKVLIGIIDGGQQLQVNPGELPLPAGATLMVVGKSKKALAKALAQPYSRMMESELERLRYLPQELARAAEAAAGGGNDGEDSCGSEDWLLAEVDAEDSAGSGSSAEKSASACREEAGAFSDGESEGGEGGGGYGAPSPPSCVPLMAGNPDSDSMDADSVPCVPPELASRLTTPAAVKAFVREFLQSDEAQQQQHEQGSINLGTAEAIAAEATAASAADAARINGGRGSTNGSYGGGGSGQRAGRGALAGPRKPAALDYGACFIDWSAEQGAGTGSFTTGGGFDGCATPNGLSTASNGGRSGDEEPPLSGHFIVCGAEESFCSFVAQLRRCGPADTPIVILHPTRPEVVCEDTGRQLGVGSGCAGGPIFYVEGSASEAASLRQAGASTARALIYLARAARPVRSAQSTEGAEKERSTREAVLADAQALLAVYGVGEESGAELTHAVVELLFTTSIEFLQPGLLLKGVNLLYDDSNIPAGAPRKSWVMRSWQQREAVAEGLAEWQANPYFAAGRVTVPALLDTFACQSFFNEGVLIDLLAELSGDKEEGPNGGAALQQVPVPLELVGRAYGELFMHLALSRKLVCMGLYRRKSENPGTRLSYVVCNPPWGEALEATDRVFVLRPRTDA